MKHLLVIILSVLSLQAFSQDTIKSTLGNDVTVTGVRAEKKTPVTQKTVTRADIMATYQGQEVPIILAKTPSVITNTDGGQPQGYTYFRLRGIDQTRINMTLNGVPLNEPEDQGVYTSNYPGFINGIQSLQIQRGVGTSTNGVSSYAGSINFQSVNGTEQGAEAQVGFGSFNTNHVSVGGSTGLSKNKFATYANISTYSSAGYKYRSGGQGYSGFLSTGYYGDNDVIKLTAFSGKSLNQMAWLAVSEADIAKDPRTNYNKDIGDADDNFTQSFVQLNYTKQFTKRSILSTSVFYNRLTGSYDYNMNGKRDLSLASNFYGVVSNYNLRVSGLNLNLGVSGNKYNRTHDMALQYVNEGFKNEASAYLKAGYDIGKLTVFGDAQVRYVTFDYKGNIAMPKQTWNFFNPKAGLTYTQSSKVNFYATVGRAHREPTRSDMFGFNDNLNNAQTFQNIPAESVTDYEVGTNVKTDRLQIQANLFYMSFNNEITLLGAMGPNSLPLTTSVKKSFRSGLEIDLNYHLTDILSLSNNATFSNNKIVSAEGNSEPLYTPKVMIRQAITLNTHGFMVSVHGLYHSKSYIDFANTAITPSFAVFGTDASYTYKKFTFLLEAVNLTNERYFTNGSVDASGTKYYYVNAPLSFYGTIKIKI